MVDWEVFFWVLSSLVLVSILPVILMAALEWINALIDYRRTRFVKSSETDDLSFEIDACIHALNELKKKGGEDDIDGWVWAVQTEDDDTIWWSDIATFADDARAEAERAFEIIWKARQYDAAQKHEAELLSVAKVMYDLLVGIRQLGGHGGPVDDGFGGWEEGVALKARCQAAIKNAEGSK